MTDDPQPIAPVFPQYPPANPAGQQFAHPKQAKPLFKIMGKMMSQRFKSSISPLKKGLATKKKKKEI